MIIEKIEIIMKMTTEKKKITIAMKEEIIMMIIEKIDTINTTKEEKKIIMIMKDKKDIIIIMKDKKDIIIIMMKEKVEIESIQMKENNTVKEEVANMMIKKITQETNIMILPETVEEIPEITKIININKETEAQNLKVGKNTIKMKIMKKKH